MGSRDVFLRLARSAGGVPSRRMAFTDNVLKRLVTPTGFEPVTLRLGI